MWVYRKQNEPKPTYLVVTFPKATSQALNWDEGRSSVGRDGVSTSPWLCVAERPAGGPRAGAGADPGLGARLLAPAAEPEGAGAGGPALPAVRPAGGVREPAGRQAGPRHE